MDISIFGYKFNLEVLILIGVIYLILVGHTFCGCCNFGMIEGMENSSDSNRKIALPTQTTSEGTPSVPTPSVSAAIAKKAGSKEGFTGANINYGESSAYDLRKDIPIDTSSWSAQNMTVSKDQPLSKGVKDFLARPKQKLPLPEGEMDFFANTKFAPEFCPNAYSNSMGCPEMTGSQYNYLITRGGNNVPYSEY